jgi:hypothetical protein
MITAARHVDIAGDKTPGTLVPHICLDTLFIVAAAQLLEEP